MAKLSDRLRWAAQGLPNKFSENDELFQLLMEAANALDKIPPDGTYISKSDAKRILDDIVIWSKGWRDYADGRIEAIAKEVNDERSDKQTGGD